MDTPTSDYARLRPGRFSGAVCNSSNFLSWRLFYSAQANQQPVIPGIEVLLSEQLKSDSRQARRLDYESQRCGPQASA